MRHSETVVRWISFGSSMELLLALFLSPDDVERVWSQGFLVFAAVGLLGAEVSLWRGFWLLVPVGPWFLLAGSSARTGPYHPGYSFWFVTAGLWLVAAPFVRKRLARSSRESGKSSD